MAPIDADEIEPGLVVFLDQEALSNHEGVTHTKDLPSFSSRTFVCISVDDDISEWVPITTEYRRERRRIPSESRTGGHPQWLRDAQYVSDGANVWRGPAQAFVEASHDEVTDRTTRARVTHEGLTAITEEVAAQRHRRDRE